MVIPEKENNIVVIGKDGTRGPFIPSKIEIAITKSASRALVNISDYQKHQVISLVEKEIRDRVLPEVTVKQIHAMVEDALDKVEPRVAKSYRDYRNFKAEFANMMDVVYNETETALFRGDKENANKDSSLNSTKKVLASGSLFKEMYRHTFLSEAERNLSDVGYIYIHDQSDRLMSMNCCLFRMDSLIKGGFEMANIWYNEPKTLKTVFDVAADVVLSAASQQYGGFTIPQVDKFLAYYAEKSYKLYYDELIELGVSPEIAEAKAEEKVAIDYKQGFQGWEYKFNTVSSSRGDYPFITVTSGLDTSKWGKLGNEIMYQVHMEGQGKPGFKRPVLFPKYVFLYDEELHKEGGECHDVYLAGLECSQKTMYPDWLSLTGEGYVPSMYKQYKAVVSPMGCRAFLSPYYERGGQDGPADENDKPVFEGRFNSGAISLNLPLIYINSLVENRPFYDVLDEILETIRNLHKRTKEYIGNMSAGTNPLSFTQGGFYGGNLRFDQKLKESKELMDSTTYSFGITALDELQYAYNGKSIAEDGRFALQVMEYINDKITEFKHEDHMLYAIYGTPAESLCFEGNTVVQCYGGNKKIKDIVPGDIVFSYNEDRHCVELKKVTAQYLTKKNAQVVKVILDNGQEVICTPNHPFAVRVMDRDAQGHIIAREHIEYVNASELKAGMRLKSNYFMYDKNVPNRKMCSIYKNGRRQLVQDIVAEYALGAKPDGFVTHHKDENPENNTFENLEYKTGKDHRIHHLSKTIAPFQYKSEDVMGENNPFYGKHHTEDSNMKNRQAHIGKSLVRTELDGSVISRFECADDAERAGFTRHLVVQACKGLRDIPESNHFYKNSLWFYEEDYLAVGDENHKVVSVEYLTETVDVYDITVEDNHNFFVGGDDGILVHNCGKQIKQLRKYTEQHSEALKEQGYEIVNIGNEMAIKGVCDREYVTNSFHCNVREDITPIQKQDLENRFWNYANGGKIQYVNTRGENIDATDMLIRRGMKLGFYQGVNHNLSYCDDCGYEESGMNTCPHCGSNSITKIDRMNGYLAYSRVKGDSRLNSAKMAEIGERVSM